MASGKAKKKQYEQYGDPPMNELRACLSVSGIFLLAALFGAAPPVHAQGDASRATPPPGKALVFVFRSDRQPVAAQVPVLVNLVRIGDLTNGTFAVATVNPGRTFLRIGEQALAVFTIEAVANRSYFVGVEAVSSVRRVRTEVRWCSEPAGRRWLAQSRLVGSAPAIAAAPRVQPPAGVAAPPRAAPPTAAPRAQPSAARSPEPSGDWNFALIAKGGAFKLANANQTVAGLASTFDTTSKPALGIEMEWRNRSGLALGGEVWLAFASLNAPPFAMSAKFQSPLGSGDRAALGCARGAAVGGAARGGAATGAGGWTRGAAAIAGAEPTRRLCASERRPSVSLTRRTSVRTRLTLG